MFRIVTIEREYGCGGGAIAKALAERLGWNLWDHRITEEIAAMAHVDCSIVERHGEKLDSRLYRLGKTFWRGSYERSIPIDVTQSFDADCMVSMMERIAGKIASEGNAVIVGRGSPYFLRDREDTFRVFLYAPRAEKIRRILADGASQEQAEELVDSVDDDRKAFIRYYFNAEWPTRALYHIMLNTVAGDEQVLDTITSIMCRMEQNATKPAGLRGIR